MKTVRIYLGYTNEIPLWRRKHNAYLEDCRWVVNCMKEWREKAGVQVGDMYDYPELEQYDGKLVIPDIYDEAPLAYLEMPEDKFLIFKLRHCK